VRVLNPSNISFSRKSICMNLLYCASASLVLLGGEPIVV
jgi:hypothetical protein